MAAGAREPVALSAHSPPTSLAHFLHCHSFGFFIYSSAYLFSSVSVQRSGSEAAVVELPAFKGLQPAAGRRKGGRLSEPAMLEGVGQMPDAARSSATHPCRNASAVRPCRTSCAVRPARVAALTTAGSLLGRRRRGKEEGHHRCVCLTLHCPSAPDPQQQRARTCPAAGSPQNLRRPASAGPAARRLLPLRCWHWCMPV